MKLKNILFLFFWGICILFEILFWIESFLLFSIQVILFWLIISLILRIFSRYREVPFLDIFLKVVSSFLVFSWIILSVFSGFVLYYNALTVNLSQIQLLSSRSWSAQSVVFLQMSHIAAPDFYEVQKKKIDELSASGYTFLIEGVSSWSLKNERKFQEMLGFEFTPSFYSLFAQEFSFVAQDNAYLFENVPLSQRVSVDLSIDEIVMLSSWTYLTPPDQVVQLETSLASVKTDNPFEKLFLHLLLRALFQWSLLHIDDISRASSFDTKLFDTILYKRNDKIVEYIEKNPTKRIAVVYGALHFEWVYNSLQNKNQDWYIASYPTVPVYGTFFQKRRE